MAAAAGQHGPLPGAQGPHERGGAEALAAAAAAGAQGNNASSTEHTATCHPPAAIVDMGVSTQVTSGDSREKHVTCLMSQSVGG